MILWKVIHNRKKRDYDKVYPQKYFSTPHLSSWLGLFSPKKAEKQIPHTCGKTAHHPRRFIIVGIILAFLSPFYTKNNMACYICSVMIFILRTKHFMYTKLLASILALHCIELVNIICKYLFFKNVPVRILINLQRKQYNCTQSHKLNGSNDARLAQLKPSRRLDLNRCHLKAIIHLISCVE